MTTQTISTIENSVLKTNEWLDELRDEGGFVDSQQAYTALRGVLHALRDRMPATEAMHLASQLPLVIRGMYFEGYKLTKTPTKERTLDGFLDHIRESMEDNQTIDPADAARSVFRMLDQHLTDGQAADVHHMLPKCITDELWANRVDENNQTN